MRLSCTTLMSTIRTTLNGRSGEKKNIHFLGLGLWCCWGGISDSVPCLSTEKKESMTSIYPSQFGNDARHTL